MDLRDYFETNKGIGVLSTADADGKVNSALYARPHFMDDETIVFIMCDRLSHENLKSNSRACYLFKQDGVYEGKRLYLTKIKEEKNTAMIDKLRRSNREYMDSEENQYLVFFHLDKVLPLIAKKR